MSAKHASVGRPTSFVLVIVIGLGVGPGVRPALGQSLADVAKKEEARRKSVPEVAKVYTNKDLNGQPSGPPPPADAKAGGADKDAGAKDAKDAGAKDAKVSKDAADVNDKQSVRDKAYWSTRLVKLQEQVNRDEAAALVLQTRNSLVADAVNRADPNQLMAIDRDRQKSIDDLARLTKAIADGKKSIADLDEEARRAGVPPGWLR